MTREQPTLWVRYIDEERFPFYDGKGIANFVEHDGPCTATQRSNAVFDVHFIQRAHALLNWP